MKVSSQVRHFVIWGGWYGSHNVGDQVLLLTITDILGKAFNGDVRFTVLTSDPRHVSHYTTRDSPWKIQALHNKRHFHQIVKAISTCDLFIFGGGVPFFEQPYHLAVMATLVGIVRAARKPYMTWAVSSQAIQSPLAKRLFRWVLNGAQALTHRDIHTYNLFQECGVNQPTYLAADSGFCLEPDSDEHAWELIYKTGYKDNSRPLVALTPRTLHGHNKDAETHYKVKSPEQAQREIDCYAIAVDWLWDHGFQPIFIPMNVLPPDDDRIASELIRRSSRHGVHSLLIQDEVYPRIAPALYRQCVFSIISRVHGSITSMIGNCPPIMYAFDLKHVGIMEAMRLSRYCILEKLATAENTIAIIEQMISENARARSSMAIRLTELRKNALIPAELISNYFDNLKQHLSKD